MDTEPFKKAFVLRLNDLKSTTSFIAPEDPIWNLLLSISAGLLTDTEFQDIFSVRDVRQLYRTQPRNFLTLFTKVMNRIEKLADLGEIPSLQMEAQTDLDRPFDEEEIDEELDLHLQGKPLPFLDEKNAYENRQLVERYRELIRTGQSVTPLNMALPSFMPSASSSTNPAGGSSTANQGASSNSASAVPNGTDARSNAVNSSGMPSNAPNSAGSNGANDNAGSTRVNDNAGSTRVNATASAAPQQDRPSPTSSANSASSTNSASSASASSTASAKSTASANSSTGSSSSGNGIPKKEMPSNSPTNNGASTSSPRNSDTRGNATPAPSGEQTLEDVIAATRASSRSRDPPMTAYVPFAAMPAPLPSMSETRIAIDHNRSPISARDSQEIPLPARNLNVTLQNPPLGRQHTTAQPSPAQPSSAQPSPVRQSPAQQMPIQRGPVQQGPIQLSPVQQGPVLPSPIRPNPVRPNPVQQGPSQLSPVQQSPFQQSPVQQHPLQQRPIQNPHTQHASTHQHPVQNYPTPQAQRPAAQQWTGYFATRSQLAAYQQLPGQLGGPPHHSVNGLPPPNARTFSPNYNTFHNSHSPVSQNPELLNLLRQRPLRESYQSDEEYQRALNTFRSHLRIINPEYYSNLTNIVNDLVRQARERIRRENIRLGIASHLVAGDERLLALASERAGSVRQNNVRPGPNAAINNGPLPASERPQEAHSRNRLPHPYGVSRAQNTTQMSALANIQAMRARRMIGRQIHAYQFQRRYRHNYINISMGIPSPNSRQHARGPIFPNFIPSLPSAGMGISAARELEYLSAMSERRARNPHVSRPDQINEEGRQEESADSVRERRRRRLEEFAKYAELVNLPDHVVHDRSFQSRRSGSFFQAFCRGGERRYLVDTTVGRHPKSILLSQALRFLTRMFPVIYESFDNEETFRNIALCRALLTNVVHSLRKSMELPGFTVPNKTGNAAEDQYYYTNDGKPRYWYSQKLNPCNKDDAYFFAMPRSHVLRAVLSVLSLKMYHRIADRKNYAMMAWVGESGVTTNILMSLLVTGLANCDVYDPQLKRLAYLSLETLLVSLTFCSLSQSDDEMDDEDVDPYANLNMNTTGAAEREDTAAEALDDDMDSAYDEMDDYEFRKYKNNRFYRLLCDHDVHEDLSWLRVRLSMLLRTRAKDPLIVATAWEVHKANNDICDLDLFDIAWATRLFPADVTLSNRLNICFLQSLTEMPGQANAISREVYRTFMNNFQPVIENAIRLSNEIDRRNNRPRQRDIVLSGRQRRGLEIELAANPDIREACRFARENTDPHTFNEIFFYITPEEYHELTLAQRSELDAAVAVGRVEQWRAQHGIPPPLPEDIFFSLPIFPEANTDFERLMSILTQDFFNDAGNRNSDEPLLKSIPRDLTIRGPDSGDGSAQPTRAQTELPNMPYVENQFMQFSPHFVIMNHEVTGVMDVALSGLLDALWNCAPTLSLTDSETRHFNEILIILDRLEIHGVYVLEEVAEILRRIAWKIGERNKDLLVRLNINPNQEPRAWPASAFNWDVTKMLWYEQVVWSLVFSTDRETYDGTRIQLFDEPVPEGRCRDPMMVTLQNAV